MIRTKTCKVCNKEKLFTEYYIHRKCADGRVGKCKLCVSKTNKQIRKDSTEKRSMNRLKYIALVKGNFTE